MPRYFFDLNDHERSPDETGTELPGLDAARVAAVKFAGDYLSDHPEIVWDGREQRVQVRQGNSNIVFTVIVLAVDGRTGDSEGAG